jgi:hypothetical protein
MEDIITTLITPLLDTRSTCVLASTSRFLNTALKHVARKHKQDQYEYLRHFGKHTTFFTIRQPYLHFNTLYITGKKRIRTRYRQKWVTIREFSFGFYTGRMDEWHQVTLTIPPFWTDTGAHVRVDSPCIKTVRSFSKIFCVNQLVRILETSWWHSRYTISTNRWSYVRNEPSSVLLLGYEE